MKMTPEEKAQVENAISMVERQTQGQIVLLVAGQSHFYGWIHALWAISGWCFTSLVLLAINYGWHFPFVLSQVIFWQVVGMNLFCLMSFLPWCKRNSLGASQREATVLQTARAHFLTASHERTSNRPIIFVFLSLFERVAYVDAEASIRARSTPDFWDKTSRELSGALAKGHWLVTTLRTIAELGELLEEIPALPASEPATPSRGRIYN